MKKFIILIAILFSLFSSTSHAWVFTGNVTIEEVVQWDSNDYIVIVMSNTAKTKCHVPLVEKPLYSLVLSLYMSGKTFNAHCYDALIDINGYPSHKLHRINAY